MGSTFRRLRFRVTSQESFTVAAKKRSVHQLLTNSLKPLEKTTIKGVVDRGEHINLMQPLILQSGVYQTDLGELVIDLADKELICSVISNTETKVAFANHLPPEQSLLGRHVICS